MCSNASVAFVAANLHVKMVKTVVQSMRPKHLVLLFVVMWGFLSPALRGEHISEKDALETKHRSKNVISF